MWPREGKLGVGEVRARPGGFGEETAPSSSCQKSLLFRPCQPPVLTGMEASPAANANARPRPW